MENKSEEEKKFENELKKLKIIAEHGATFSENNEHNIPTDIESQWLTNIMAFENASKNNKSRKIKEILENPSFAPVNKLSDQQLSEALKNAQNLLADHNINLESIYNASERELYSFISTDFLEVEMDVIDVAGMVSHFTYEEFCPNDEGDIKHQTEEVIKDIFAKNYDFIEELMTKEVIYKNTTIACAVFIKNIEQLLAHIEKLSLTKISFNAININNAKASIVCNIGYSKEVQSAQTKHNEEINLSFIHQYGYWFVQSITIPNLGI